MGVRGDRLFNLNLDLDLIPGCAPKPFFGRDLVLDFHDLGPYCCQRIGGDIIPLSPAHLWLAGHYHGYAVRRVITRRTDRVSEWRTHKKPPLSSSVPVRPV